MTKQDNITLALMADAMAGAFKSDAEKRPVAPAPAKAKPVVYFADNSRLRPDAYEQRAEVDALCVRLGLTAEWPDEHYLFPTGLTVAEREAEGPPINDPAAGRALRNAWRKIADCEVMVAEATPFRGPHLNPLIAFEIGAAVALQIPVFAWTTAVWSQQPGDAAPRFKLLEHRIWSGEKVAPDGNWRDEEDGTIVESFGLLDAAQIAGNFKSLSASREDAIRRVSAEFYQECWG